ncbi:rhamnogalacturonan acetylesterase [Kribbella deserti]|uniref:Rhamnogalacturonan acetylesterase n=1 Tax=Kribbella deserti TaxID=1926257 RepID=A0ABV6QHN4_9ACTN
MSRQLRRVVSLTTSLTAATVLFGTAAPATTLALAAPVENCEGVGTAQVLCSFDVAPGIYRVALALPTQEAAAVSVTAEARRVMLPPVMAGRAKRHQAFAVDVRAAEGEPTLATGTPGLQVRLTSADGGPVRLDSIAVHPLRQVRTLFLAGDSTVCDQANAPYTGWGQRLPQFFNAHLAVANYADSGEGSASFLANDALMPAMEQRIRAGDFVMIQFGHNDKATTAADYRRNLGEILDRVMARGGRPILVTPTVRQLFDSTGQLNQTALHVNGLGVNLPAEMRALATERDVPLIDLTSRSEELVESLGPTDSSALYLPEKKDRTHNSEYGADQMARLLLADLPLPLQHYLRR